IISGDMTLTFGEFDSAVNRCANTLTARGLVKGERLALVSHNCWQFAVLHYATARLGVVLVPVNFGLGPEEIAY
ncbi:AMP-binding protein, partial [Streptomyces sp. SID10244]|nr:AMP-binding protein [Streptomyces sp. SID10244]